MKFLTCETTFGSYLCVLTESYSTRDGHMRNYNNNNRQYHYYYYGTTEMSDMGGTLPTSE